jgi:WD domain, G-beta repeat
MLDEIVHNLERHDRSSRIKKLVFCACTNNWSNEAQHLSGAKFKTYLQQLYDKHESIVQLKYLLYRIVIRLNHSGDYYTIANTICQEMEKLYSSAVPMTIPRAPTQLNPSSSPHHGNMPTEMNGAVVLFTVEDIQAGTAIQVDMRVMTADRQSIAQTMVTLTGADRIFAQYQEWQGRYRRLDPHAHRLASDKAVSLVPGRVNECLDAGALFQASLHQWYGSRAFQTIRDRLATTVSLDTELKVITIAQSKLLLRLPWAQIWQPILDRYPHAEVSLALSPPAQNEGISADARVKVLSILASGQGIKVDKSIEFLNALPHTKAEFAVAPTYREFVTRVSEESWGVLFISSYLSGYLPTNRIYLNHDYTIAIPEFKHRIQQAVNRGLKMLILNCGDGLDLAAELADLPIPYLIVMREAVQDQVAQEFVKLLLKNFAGGKSIYTAARAARERLEAIEKVVPSASWLPIICHPTISGTPNWASMAVEIQPEVAEEIHTQGWQEADPTGLFMSSDLSPAVPESTSLAPINYQHTSLSQKLSGYFSDVCDLSFSLEGAYLASGHSDVTNVDNAIKIWRMEDGKLSHNLLRHQGAVTGVCMLPDRQTIVSGSADGYLRWWDYLNGGDCERTVQNKSPIDCVAVTEDGYTLVTGDRQSQLKIWNARDGQLLCTVPKYRQDITALGIHSLSHTIVTGSSDSSIDLWHLDGRLIRTITGAAGKVTSIAISSDGRRLVSIKNRKTIEIWDAETGNILHQPITRAESLDCLVISPESQTLFTAGVGPEIELWSLDTGHLVHTLPSYDRAISALSLSTNGRIIAAASYGEIQLWRAIEDE